MAPVLLEMLSNLYSEIAGNYKLIIIQFNEPALLVQIPTMLKLSDITSNFRTVKLVRLT